MVVTHLTKSYKYLCSRFVRGGVNTNQGWETVNPSVTTKVCFTCACLYTFLPSDMSYIAMVGLTVALKVGPLFGVTILDKTLAMVEEKIVPALFRRLPAKDNEGKKDE